MNHCQRIFEIFHVLFLGCPDQKGLIDFMAIFLSGDGTPVYTAIQEWKKRYMTVNVTVSIASRTVTSAGVPVGTAISLAMSSICLRPPISEMIFRFSLSWIGFQAWFLRVILRMVFHETFPAWCCCKEEHLWFRLRWYVLLSMLHVTWMGSLHLLVWITNEAVSQSSCL